MSKIAELRPDEVRTYADQLEDDAYKMLPGPRRQRLLVFAYTLRKRANLAEWLGLDHVKAEIAEKGSQPRAW